MREANEGWARYVGQIVNTRFDGNQSAMAQALHVAASTVTRWIDGATPTIRALQEMSAALDIPMTELLRAAGALKEPDFTADGRLHRVETTAPQQQLPDAIRNDPRLIEVAKNHLLRQYELLAQLSDLSTTTDGHSPSPPKRSLRAVARPRPPAKRPHGEGADE